MATMRWVFGWAVLVGLGAASACGGDDNANLVKTGGGAGGTSGDGSAASGGTANAAGMGATGTGGNWAEGGITGCQGHIYACGDGLDNDNDGKIDAQDPDCLGPCDNTEDSYFGGIPGQNNAPCTMDCYFDQDTGAGNDDCYWSHKCDPLAVAPDYPPEGLDQTNKPYCQYDKNAKTPGTNQSCDQLYAQQSNTCMSYCGPLTPNGCDCFGCCELPAGGGKYVWLGSTVNGAGSCDIASLADPMKCKPCTPVKACQNSCDHCELCIGKDKLPDDCYPPDSGTEGGTPDAGDGGYTGQCAAGVQPCGLAGQAPCGNGFYCITGCCIAIPQ